MAWGGGGGWSDWRSRARTYAQSRGTNRGTSGRRTQQQQRRAEPWAQVPQSEQRFTGGYNSPLHNVYVSQFTGNGIPATRADYSAFYEATNGGLGTGALPSYAPPGGGGGGGGGWGGGGGGGGGGGPALTQAMLDQMLKALAASGLGLNYRPVDLPSFAGTNLPAFNQAPYTQATNQLTGAFNADIAAAQQATQQATAALNANYTNPYANAQVTAAPVAQSVGAGLQASAGGGGGEQAAAVADANAAGASDQASFTNLLNVLAATDQAAQSSRLNQAALDLGTARQGISAQRRGLLGGINMARTQAANEWAQRDAERRYQNSLMRQQWNREELMRNQDLGNQAAQANWQARNEMINSRIAPLLQLLGTTSGLDLAGVQQLLAGWGR